MNKRLLAIVISVLVCLLSLQKVSAAGNNSGQAHIDFFKVGDTGVTITVASNRLLSDNAACTGSTKSSVAALSVYLPRFSELYAAIMLAHANGRDIAFWLDGCVSNVPGGPYPSIVTVYVY